MSGSLCFYGCSRLVGGEGFVPGYSDGADHLAYGEEGVLTDPASDGREWLSCHLYADGEIAFTLDDEPETGRALCMSGRMCATARYQAIDARAWEDAEVDVLKATFSADLSSLDFVNLNYWFYGDNGALGGRRALEPAGGSRDALCVLQLRLARGDRPFRLPDRRAGGRVLLLLRMRLAHDDLGGRRLGASRRMHGVGRVL